MTSVDVAQEGIPSVSHMRDAKMKIAIVRCSVSVRSGIPKASEGKHHTIRLISVTAIIFKAFDDVLFSAAFFCFLSS